MLWQIATRLFAYPDYLAYFNVLAGNHPGAHPGGLGSGLGRPGLRRLEQVLAARHVQLWLGYKGTADLSREALPPYTLLKPNQPVTGWVAITMLTLQENQAGYGWLALPAGAARTASPSIYTTSPRLVTIRYNISITYHYVIL